MTDLTPTTLTGPSGREYTLHGPKGDHQVNHWRMGHFYEGNEGGVLEWAYENPHYFERVVDIGASLGNHSVFFAGELGSEVIAIEPYTSDLVQKNVDANGLGDRVRVKRELIGKPGLYRAVPGPRGNIGMTSYTPCNAFRADCRGRLLDDVIGDFRPTAIKIDVEGMEEDVLLMSCSVLPDCTPAVIMEARSASMLATLDYALLPLTRLPQVFNSTPTHVWIPS